MINLKKTLIAVLLFSGVILSLSGVSAQSNEGKSTTRSVAETNIVLSDDGAASNTNNNDGVSTVKKSSSGVFVFLRMLVVLIIVIGLIWLVFYFIKKKTNFVKTDDEYLRRAAYINIAPGKSVEVITLIDKAYLIGVTEENITLLGEINDEELIKAMNITSDKKNSTKKPATFSDVLDMFLVKGNKQKNVFEDSELKVDSVVGSEDKEESKE